MSILSYVFDEGIYIVVRKWVGIRIIIIKSLV